MWPKCVGKLPYVATADAPMPRNCGQFESGRTIWKSEALTVAVHSKSNIAAA
jgi:hypothetical protein